MNRILFIALVLALGCVTSVTGNQRKFFRLARCFNDTEYETIEDTKTCLGNVSTCFDDTTIETVQTCITDGIAEARANRTDDSGTRLLGSHMGGGGRGGRFNASDLGSAAGERGGFGSGGFRPQNRGKMGKLASIVRGCLETQKECIREEVQAFINKLPECVNTTARALGECYKTNAESCATTCSEADIPSDNPFAGVASATIKACAGFQNRIMDPACDIVDCCPECTAEFDALMTCVGQDLLELKPEPCDLSCSADSSTRRELGVTPLRKQYVMRKLAGHIESAPEASIIAEECATYLDTEEETLTADAVTELITNGEFVGCVADVAILVAEEQKEFDGAHTGGDGTGSSASIRGMAVAGLASLMLGLAGLM